MWSGRAASAAERCSRPTGGLIPREFSGCVGMTNTCYTWMNAKCVSGWCLCEKDECIMEGQCVPKGECSNVTGGSCDFAPCDRWRNASCSEKAGHAEPKCVCGTGTCPIKGECRPPGTCAKSTGGSCKVLDCKAWRRSTCSVSGLPGAAEEARCMCGEGLCPINGECVPQGGCPRYAGASCRVYAVTGLAGCSVGECTSSAYCACKEGECFSNGQCIPADAAGIALSRKWGEAQELAAVEDAGGEEYLKANRALALAFVATLVMTAGCVAMKRAARKGGVTPTPSGYEHLEG